MCSGAVEVPAGGIILKRSTFDYDLANESAELLKGKNRRKCIAFGGFWYARLDSNQWPLESESSDDQLGNCWGPMVLLVLGKFLWNYKKPPEALRCNASGDFYGSSQIVVCNKR